MLSEAQRMNRKMRKTRRGATRGVAGWLAAFAQEKRRQILERIRCSGRKARRDASHHRAPVGPQTPTSSSGKKGVGVWVRNTFVDPLATGCGWVTGSTEVSSYQPKSPLSLLRISGTSCARMVHIQGPARRYDGGCIRGTLRIHENAIAWHAGPWQGQVLFPVAEPGVFAGTAIGQQEASQLDWAGGEFFR